MTAARGGTTKGDPMDSEKTSEPQSLRERLDWLEQAYREQREALHSLAQNTGCDLATLAREVGVHLPSQTVAVDRQINTPAAIGGIRSIRSTY